MKIQANALRHQIEETHNAIVVLEQEIANLEGKPLERDEPIGA